MIPKLKILFFLVMLLMGKALHAQDLDARSPQPAPVGKQQKTAEKKKALQQKKFDKSVAKPGIEPGTFGLWARRATAALPRGANIVLPAQAAKSFLK